MGRNATGAGVRRGLPPTQLYPDTAEKRPLTGWNSRLRPGIPGDMAKTKLDGLGEYPPILGERVRSTNAHWLVRTYTELRLN